MECYQIVLQPCGYKSVSGSPLVSVGAGRNTLYAPFSGAFQQAVPPVVMDSEDGSMSAALLDYDVAEYMTKLDGKLHPALLARPGSGIIFDGVRKRWVLEADGTECKIPYDEIYKITFEARDQLIATVNTYRKKLKQPLLNLNSGHNWTDVNDCVQTACTGLETLAIKDKDMSGSLGRVKKAFRGLCRNAGAGQTCTTLVPNDAFGFASVLCGGLKVVFQCLRTTELYRVEVYKILEELPQRLKDLAEDVSMYDQDEEIHRRAAALYAAAFKLLNHILHWFLKKAWGRYPFTRF